MLAMRRCWWCGHQAEVDTELPELNGLIRDTATSWICSDDKACGKRALEDMMASGRRGTPIRPLV